MGQDQRERHRLKRAQKKQRKARHVVVQAQSAARHDRAVTAAVEADRLLREGSFSEALPFAARAAVLDPSNRRIAALFAHAAEMARDVPNRILAYENLLRSTGPDASVLISLASLYLASRRVAEARDAAARARVCLPARMRERRRWLTLLENVEARAGLPAAPGETGATLPLFGAATGPSAAGAARRDASQRASQTLIAGGSGQAPASREAARRAPPPAAAAISKSEPPRAPKPGRDDRRRDHAALSAAAQPPASAVDARRAEPDDADGVHAVPTFDLDVAVDATIAGVEALGRDGFASPERVRLALLAARARDAESFDSLLALERAQGLLRLSHQEETARKVLSVFLGRALLADEVGLGKTVEAGLVLSEYLLRGRVERALVLAPPSLVSQWRAELRSKFGIDCRTSEGPEMRRDPGAFWAGRGVVVASLATARSPQHRDAVAAHPWDLVIVDEAHALKNARTLSYALVERLTSRFLLLLTATPVENDVEELYNLVSLLRPGHLGARAEFVRRLGGRRGRPSEGARCEVRSLLGEIMVRNTRALSGVRLPPRFARTVLVAPTAAEDELYRHLVAALRAVGTGGRTRLLLSTLLQEAGSSPLAVAETLRKLDARESGAAAHEALAPAVRHIEQLPDSAKGEALLRVLESADGPAVVFTRYRATLSFIEATLTRRGIACERVDGSTPIAARHEAIARCRERGSVLASTDVGSEGLNLQFCHRLVNFDLPWNPMRIEQRIGRLHRIGQEHAVDVVNLCLAGSIEERILRILDERINLFELVVGEAEMILGYLEEEREFPDLVLEAFAEEDGAARESRFGRIADALAAARTRYQNVKSFDEALFRNELGV